MDLSAAAEAAAAEAAAAVTSSPLHASKEDTTTHPASPDFGPEVLDPLLRSGPWWSLEPEDELVYALRSARPPLLCVGARGMAVCASLRL